MNIAVWETDRVDAVSQIREDEKVVARAVWERDKNGVVSQFAGDRKGCKRLKRRESQRVRLARDDVF